MNLTLVRSKLSNYIMAKSDQPKKRSKKAKAVKGVIINAAVDVSKQVKAQDKLAGKSSVKRFLEILGKK